MMGKLLKSQWYDSNFDICIYNICLNCIESEFIFYCISTFVFYQLFYFNFLFQEKLVTPKKFKHLTHVDKCHKDVIVS